MGVFKVLFGGLLTSQLLYLYRTRKAINRAHERFECAKANDKVIVIGGGISGLTTAYELWKEGYDVTVLEKQGGVALETSAANAGTLNYRVRNMVATPENAFMGFRKLYYIMIGEKLKRQHSAAGKLKVDANGFPVHNKGNPWQPPNPSADDGFLHNNAFVDTSQQRLKQTSHNAQNDPATLKLNQDGLRSAPTSASATTTTTETTAPATETTATAAATAAASQNGEGQAAEPSLTDQASALMDDLSASFDEVISLVDDTLSSAGYFFLERKLLLKPEFWKWSINFISQSFYHINDRKEVLDDLIELSLSTLAKTRDELDLKFEYRSDGALFVYPQEDQFYETAEEALLATYDEIAITPNKAKAIEPSLKHFSFPGAIFHQHDSIGNCQLFCKQLETALAARGVKFMFYTQATAFDVDSKTGKVTGVVTKSARPVQNSETGQLKHSELKESAPSVLPCDYVVVCGGYESNRPLQSVGLQWLPIMPVKGYSITGKANPDPEKCPLNYILIEEPLELMITRLGEDVRFASYAEISLGQEASEKRITDLLALVDKLFPEAFLDRDDIEVWCGRRPVTSDALPIVGPSNIPNVVLNTGHGSDGWRFAHGTARIVGDIMSGRRSAFDFERLSLRRFPIL